MDHARAQDAHQSKASKLWHRDCGVDSDDKSTHTSTSPSQGEARPIRRVQSPTRPRAWSSNSYKPKFGGKCFKPRFLMDDHAFYKPGFVHKRQHPLNQRAHLNQRDHLHPKPHHSAQREQEKEMGRYEWRQNDDGASCPKQRKVSRPFLPRSVSSRDKDTQFTVCLNDRSHSKTNDHRGSKEKEQSRDRELPLTASQTPTRDRAIQQKRGEIDEMYNGECQMFGLVTKMLIEKEPSLEHLIQSSLQENLRDIGKRCVDAMEKFIEEYDSREPLH